MFHISSLSTSNTIQINAKSQVTPPSSIPHKSEPDKVLKINKQQQLPPIFKATLQASPGNRSPDSPANSDDEYKNNLQIGKTRNINNRLVKSLRLGGYDSNSDYYQIAKTVSKLNKQRDVKKNIKKSSSFREPALFKSKNSFHTAKRKISGRPKSYEFSTESILKENSNTVQLEENQQRSNGGAPVTNILQTNQFSNCIANSYNLVSRFLNDSDDIDLVSTKENKRSVKRSIDESATSYRPVKRIQLSTTNNTNTNNNNNINNNKWNMSLYALNNQTKTNSNSSEYLINSNNKASVLATDRRVLQPSISKHIAQSTSNLPTVTNDNSMYTTKNDEVHVANHVNNTNNSMPASIAALSNIGNTCYLNSVIYTLRFAPHFLHNLHHLIDNLSHINQKLGQNRAKSSSLGRNIGGLSGQSTRSWSTKDLATMGTSTCETPRTPQQYVTEQLHDLFTNLHRNEIYETNDAFHADTFLSAIQGVSSIFEGNQQQDAHEFLMCLLDSIRETCQSLKKVLTDCPDIIMNGYANLGEKNESTISSLTNATQTPLASTNSTSRFNFFRKKKPDEKSKQQQQKQNDNFDHSKNVTTNNVNAITTNDHSIENNSTTADVNDGISSSDICNKTTKRNEQINEKLKKIGLDFFTEDFEGVTVSSTKCLICETVTEQKETMIDLSVPIPCSEKIEAIDDPKSIFRNLCITAEIFKDSNKYHCEACSRLTEARRTISYPVLPRLLIIQLKRFSGGMEKINSYIPTPFTMQCFCSKCNALADTEKLHMYKLYSVITHVGATLSVGHYIAYTCARDNYNEYVQCQRNKRQAAASRLSQTMPLLIPNGIGNGAAAGIPPSSANSSEKSSAFLKKYVFGRNKASSSGDVTKNLKNLNGGSFSKTNSNSSSIQNGVGGVDKNGALLDDSGKSTACSAVNCCGILTKNEQDYNGLSPALARQHLYTNLSDPNAVMNTTPLNLLDSNPVIINTTNNSSAAMLTENGPFKKPISITTTKCTNNSNTEPTWFMCDDDKIKAMSQKEFEELLSPKSKQIMITPYLLFYARIDVQKQH